MIEDPSKPRWISPLELSFKNVNIFSLFVFMYQSILKEISPECSLEGLMLKLKLQYFGHLMWRTDSLEQTVMLGKIEGSRRRGRQRMRWLDASPTQWPCAWVNSGSWWWTGRPNVLQSMESQSVGQDWATELNYVTVLQGTSQSMWPLCLITTLSQVWLKLTVEKSIPPDA